MSVVEGEEQGHSPVSPVRIALTPEIGLDLTPEAAQLLRDAIDRALKAVESH